MLISGHYLSMCQHHIIYNKNNNTTINYILYSLLAILILKAYLGLLKSILTLNN